MTIQMVGALMAAPILDDREHAVLSVICNHCGEWAGFEEAAFPSLELIAVEARKSRRTVVTAIDVMCAIGVLRKIPGQGRTPNTYVPNLLWLEDRRHFFSTLRRSLREEQGPKAWVEPFMAAISDERAALYREGVEARLIPKDWPRMECSRAPMIDKVLRRSGATVAPQRPKTPVENAGFAPLRKDACGANETPCGANEAACGATMVAPKPPEPSLTPEGAREKRADSVTPDGTQPSGDGPGGEGSDGLGGEGDGSSVTAPPTERRQRQAIGQGAYDRDGRTMQGLQEAVAFWAAGAAWGAPSGMTFHPGLAPDDPDAEEGFGLGPFALKFVIDRVVRPAVRGGAVEATGRFVAAAAQIRALASRDAQAARDRLGILEALLARLVARKQRGEAA